MNWSGKRQLTSTLALIMTHLCEGFKASFQHAVDCLLVCFYLSYGLNRSCTPFVHIFQSDQSFDDQRHLVCRGIPLGHQLKELIHLNRDDSDLSSPLLLQLTLASLSGALADPLDPADRSISLVSQAFNLFSSKAANFCSTSSTVAASGLCSCTIKMSACYC